MKVFVLRASFNYRVERHVTCASGSLRFLYMAWSDWSPRIHSAKAPPDPPPKIPPAHSVTLSKEGHIKELNSVQNFQIKKKRIPYFIDPSQHLQRTMSSNYQTMIRAHLPVIIDYLGLGTSSLYSLAIAWQPGWLHVLCSHRYCTHRLLKPNFRRWPCVSGLCSRLCFTCPRTLSRPYPASNSHPLWRASCHWNRFDRFLCPGFNTHWSPINL